MMCVGGSGSGGVLSIRSQTKRSLRLGPCACMCVCGLGIYRTEVVDFNNIHIYM